jgi:hypothetical protein
MLSRKLVLLGILVTAVLGLVVAGCGDNTSLTRPPVDEQPLAAPEGITATVDVITGAVSLSWLPPASVGVAGYNVYKFEPTPLREGAYVRITQAPVAQPTLTCFDFQEGGDFLLKAVRTSGAEGLASRPVHLNPYTGPPDDLRRH